MALGFPKPIRQDDPRLKGHETTYQASRGGHFPPPQQQRAQGKNEVTLERLDGLVRLHDGAARRCGGAEHALRRG
ncbi:hypothetical protein ACFCV9_39060, partial [Streptomyces sp. NPDC056367]|uniref:hypothetical protein n=1 Tax=Streptomyces sp. NPDC056367 TaxID=3345797 RepID=UPI0035E25A1B